MQLFRFLDKIKRIMVLLPQRYSWNLLLLLTITIIILKLTPGQKIRKLLLNLLFIIITILFQLQNLITQQKYTQPKTVLQNVLVVVLFLQIVENKLKILPIISVLKLFHLSKHLRINLLLYRQSIFKLLLLLFFLQIIIW